MSTSDYDELKEKYKALLEENKVLKAKIRQLAPKSQTIISHHKPVQVGETLFRNFKKPASNQNSGASISAQNNVNAVTQYSENHEKINLFMSLFKGRTDVYAKKWVYPTVYIRKNKTN